MDKTVLIVDDDEMERKMICDVLSDDCNIIESECGHDAMDTIDEMHNVISVIILDYMMPDGNGLDVLEHMNKTNDIKKIPVLMLTGERHNDVEKKCLEMGAVDYRKKPVEAMKELGISRSCYYRLYSKF